LGPCEDVQVGRGFRVAVGGADVVVDGVGVDEVEVGAGVLDALVGSLGTEERVAVADAGGLDAAVELEAVVVRMATATCASPVYSACLPLAVVLVVEAAVGPADDGRSVWPAACSERGREAP